MSLQLWVRQIVQVLNKHLAHTHRHTFLMLDRGATSFCFSRLYGILSDKAGNLTSYLDIQEKFIGLQMSLWIFHSLQEIFQIVFLATFGCHCFPQIFWIVGNRKHCYHVTAVLRPLPYLVCLQHMNSTVVPRSISYIAHIKRTMFNLNEKLCNCQFPLPKFRRKSCLCV